MHQSSLCLHLFFYWHCLQGTLPTGEGGEQKILILVRNDNFSWEWNILFLLNPFPYSLLLSPLWNITQWILVFWLKNKLRLWNSLSLLVFFLNSFYISLLHVKLWFRLFRRPKRHQNLQFQAPKNAVFDPKRAIFTPHDPNKPGITVF